MRTRLWLHAVLERLDGSHPCRRSINGPRWLEVSLLEPRVLLNAVVPELMESEGVAEAEDDAASDQNQAPVLDLATFFIEENSPAGTPVGIIPAFDPDAEEPYTLEILEGNVQGAFSLEPGTGELRVANAAVLDFECRPSFSLVILATDGQGAGRVGVVRVSLTNVSIPPIAVNDELISESRTFFFDNADFVGNDISPEGEKLVVVGFADLGGGRIIDLGDLTFIYTAPEGVTEGPVHFTYFVRDDSGNISSATMTLQLKVVHPLHRESSPLPDRMEIFLGMKAVPEPTTLSGAIRMARPAARPLEENPPGPAPPPEEFQALPVSASHQKPTDGHFSVVAAISESETQIASSLWESDAFHSENTQRAAPRRIPDWSAISSPEEHSSPGMVEALTSILEASSEEIAEVFELGEGSLLWQALDAMEAGLLAAADGQRMVVGTAATVSSALAVAYVLWMTRGGVLVGSLLAQMPAWRLVDPLPILEHLDRDMDPEAEDQESLQTIIEGSLLAV